MTSENNVPPQSTIIWPDVAPTGYSKETFCSNTTWTISDPLKLNVFLWFVSTSVSSQNGTNQQAATTYHSLAAECTYPEEYRCLPASNKTRTSRQRLPALSRAEKQGEKSSSWAIVIPMIILLILSQCDGRKPSCAPCIQRLIQCKYGDATRHQELLQRIKSLEKESLQLRKVVEDLLMGPEVRAIEVLRYLRTMTDPMALLQIVPEGEDSLVPIPAANLEISDGAERLRHAGHSGPNMTASFQPEPDSERTWLVMAWHKTFVSNFFPFEHFLLVLVCRPRKAAWPV